MIMTPELIVDAASCRLSKRQDDASTMHTATLNSQLSTLNFIKRAQHTATLNSQLSTGRSPSTHNS